MYLMKLVSKKSFLFLLTLLIVGLFTKVAPLPALVDHSFFVLQQNHTGNEISQASTTSLMPAIFGGKAPVSKGGLTDWGLPPVYGQTGWPTAHRDSRNSDYAPFVLPSSYQIKWNALDRQGEIPGSATFFGPSQGIDGGLWQHSGRGTGFSHFHKIDPANGDILFETPPWAGSCLNFNECLDQDLSTPDNAVVAQAPLVDVDGNVYIADFDQYWSFDKDGGLRWVVHFNDLITPIGEVTSSFISSIISKEGYVGGITADCHLVLLNRADGTLAVPVLVLPCGPTTPNNPALFSLNFMWYSDGEVYFPFRQLILEGLFGEGPPNVNTPSVDPQTGRIFFVHRDAVDPDNHDAVTAIDLVDDGAGGKEAVIAWTSQLGPNSGASVAISPDGSEVYTVDGNSTIWGFDAQTGDAIFSTGGLGQAAASPTVGPDGFVYAAGTEVLVSLNPDDGSIRWLQNFDFIAQDLLPTLEPTESDLLVPDGTPRAYAINVVSRSENKVWTTLVLGYLYNGLIPLLEALGGQAEPTIIPHKNILIATDPSTGEMIDGAITEYIGGNEGLIELNPDGSIYISKADIIVSPFYWTFNSTLPERFRTPEIPKGGITAFEPTSFRDFSLEGIASVQNQIGKANSELLGGDVDNAFTQVRYGRLQLGFTADSVMEANERGEITSQQANEARELLQQAADGPMTEAYDLLFADNPSTEDQNQAKSALLQAEILLNSAAAILQ